MRDIFKKPENFDIRRLSRLKVAEHIENICFPESIDEIIYAYRYAKDNNLKPFPLGAGSNVLIGNVYSYLIISDMRMPKKMEIINNTLRVSSNININSAIAFMIKNNLSGLEFLSGVPAHIGGLVSMNAGAYGYEICQFIKSLNLVNENGEAFVISTDLKPVYRNMNLDAYVSEVCFETIKSGADLRSIVKKFILKRKESQPLSYPNIGCFFKNVKQGETLISAGKLIDECSLKGYKIGGAMISPMHANFLINQGNASFGDFENLIAFVREKVYKRFNVNLELEVRLLND